ncbi:unnamed protein product [Ambrosiozyma monospora]|uniref:Unnamed protein product n=1 Tax=Ambrosiozyma monospora TaxID=43982 RepID=A0ACB5T3K7_AMBMO|nr:unnamed protein product [Ambrosiozyma monospora]
MSDLEKGADIKGYEKNFNYGDESFTNEVTETEPTKLTGIYANLMEMFHGETRGIERIPEEEKTQTSLLTAASMWFSANLVIATFSLGALSYGVYKLDFGTAVLFWSKTNGSFQIFGW